MSDTSARTDREQLAAAILLSPSPRASRAAVLTLLRVGANVQPANVSARWPFGPCRHVADQQCLMFGTRAGGEGP